MKITTFTRTGITFLWAATLLLTLAQCDSNEASDSTDDDNLTGNSVTYLLDANGELGMDGTAVLYELKDSTALLRVTLDDVISSSYSHPLHFHLGDVSVDGAYVAVVLNPVDGETGISETVITELADETPVTYSEIKAMEACLKVHQTSFGENQDVILSAGNIGSAVSNASGRSTIGVCSSNLLTADDE